MPTSPWMTSDVGAPSTSPTPMGTWPLPSAPWAPARAQSATYVEAVQQLLRLVEGVEVRAASGQTTYEMATTQAAFLRANPSVPHSGGWGGAAPGKTRWDALTDDQKRDWTRRGTVAIGLMVAHAATAAPELALSAANFELDFEGVDSVSLGAFATVGSQPGKNVQVGFEFTVTCELNPAYALSTVVHELHGHPVFDAAGSNFAGSYTRRRPPRFQGPRPATRPTSTIPRRSIACCARSLTGWRQRGRCRPQRDHAGGQSRGIDSLNPDPRRLIAGHLRAMEGKWAKSLLEPLLRGFWRRISLDPGSLRRPHRLQGRSQGGARGQGRREHHQMNDAVVEDALGPLAAPPGGRPGALAARDQALSVLLSAPDQAHPRLLELALGPHPRRSSCSRWRSLAGRTQCRCWRPGSGTATPPPQSSPPRHWAGTRPPPRGPPWSRP